MRPSAPHVLSGSPRDATIAALEDRVENLRRGLEATSGGADALRQREDECAAKLTGDLATAQGAVRTTAATLGGEPAVEILAEGAEHDAWSVHFVTRHHLICEVTLHDGPSATEETRQEIKGILKSFRLLDR